MKDINKLLIRSIVGFLILSGCSPTSQSDQSEVTGEAQLDSIVVIDTIPEFVPPEPHPYLNSFTQVISGMEDSIPGVEIDSALIYDYKVEMAKQLGKLKRKRLLPLRFWYADILRNDNRDNMLPVFYPFSGGDFLHLYNVYPNANQYIMMAIEPVGSIPNFRESTDEYIFEYLKSVEFNLRDIFKRSYFITKNMKQDIKENPNIDGMLPSILWGVGATGHQVIDILGARIDSTGNLFTAPTDSFGKDVFEKGVQIIFYDERTEITKTVTYLSYDISDKGIVRNLPLNTFLNNLPPNNAFLKAASYLPHYSSFSNIRNCLLAHSENLLQDDTGIPFKYFEEDGHKVQLYGDYVMPVSDFNPNLFQRDMSIKYRDTSYYQGSLPFSMGYHWGSRQQNQMVVMKTKPTDVSKLDEPLLAENQVEKEDESDSEPEVAIVVEDNVTQPEVVLNSDKQPSSPKKEKRKEQTTSARKAMVEKSSGLDESNNATNQIGIEGIVFRVQILASSRPLKTDSPVFKLQHVKRYIESGLFKFTVGEFKTFEQAQRLSEDMRRLGYDGAFVVSFKDGKRLSNSDLRKLMGTIKTGLNKLFMNEDGLT